ncbi:hypothetical protein VTO42DRAFT_5773 [Malbranchea cinnamomea]
MERRSLTSQGAGINDAKERHTQDAKRRKISHNDAQHEDSGTAANGGSVTLASLSRSVTPPPCRQKPHLNQSTRASGSTTQNYPSQDGYKVIPSPFQLTHIRDLSDTSGYNLDTVKLRDILGDPMIKECWQFNYLFDVDFLMNQFDPDVRDIVQVKVVHGSWRREAPNRIGIDKACSRYANVEAIIAYMPEPFGTHHSKMMILIRHDDQAQVIIHTANMIPGDWANMCQAVWRSPLLPLLSENGSTEDLVAGSGYRFKRDLLAYLAAYGPKKTGPLVEQLKKYDFGAIRAALVASVPSRQELGNLNSDKETIWGWPALKDILSKIPSKPRTDSEKRAPHIVVQISSIATLGQTDKWLKETFFRSLFPETEKPTAMPKFSIIFPTPDEIRRSLNGYGSGGSIHMKTESAAQKKQLEYLRPYLCHWAGDQNDTPRTLTQPSDGGQTSQRRDGVPIREAGRRRAAPHIKTYIRFSDASMTSIDWAMVTSANLSTQAWGAAPNAKKEVRICSWEIGVIVWPDLFVDDHQKGAASARMVPCFRRDVPSPSPECDEGAGEDPRAAASLTTTSTLVGIRMPYDVPLKPYSKGDMPWCASSNYTEPDWLGQTWASAE